MAQPVEIPTTFFVSDELRKIFLTFGLQQLLLVVDLFSFYVNCVDLQSLLGFRSNFPGPLFNLVVAIGAIYDFAEFYVLHMYIMKMPTVYIGRIQYLRTKFFKTGLRVK